MAGYRDIPGRTDRNRALVAFCRHRALTNVREGNVEPRIAVEDLNRAVARRGREDWPRGGPWKNDRADGVDDAALVAWSKGNAIRLVLKRRRNIDSDNRVAGKRHANRARHVRI